MMAVSVLRRAARGLAKAPPSLGRFSAGRNDLFRQGVRRRTIEASRLPLTPERYFPRREEEALFRRILNGRPQITHLSGSLDAGRTTCMLQGVLPPLAKTRAVAEIDLRATPLTCISIGHFTKFFEGEMRKWLEEFSRKRYSKAKGFNYQNRNKFTGPPELLPCDFGLEAFYVRKRIRKMSGVEKPEPEGVFSSMLRAVGECFPFHRQLVKNESPILFIDHAEKLLEMKKVSEFALQCLFAWMIYNTKDTRRFHVVLASNDSLFHEALERYVGNTRFTSHEIGDLSEEEARQYWNQLISRRRFSHFPPPKFSDAYAVCGGKIFHLDRYLSEYIISGGRMKPKDFSIVLDTHLRLFRHMDGKRSGIDYLNSETFRSGSWTKEKFVAMMRALVSANGSVSYKDLIQQIGFTTVRALIREGFLVFRQGRTLTAPDQAHLVAMRQLLKESA